ncbi:TPA: hypothetical protein ACNVDX_002269 [Citrobacter gillenii]
MVTTNDLRIFIKTKNYISLFNEVTERLNINTDKNEPSSQLFNIHAGCVNKSGVSLGELEKLCDLEKERLVEYARLKNIEIEDDEDEYNESDDKAVTLEILPFPKSFLIGDLIEFYLLKNNPSALTDYLKKLRIPGSLKYAKELKSIYSRL